MIKEFYPKKSKWFVTITDEDKAYQRIVNLIRDTGDSPEPQQISVLHHFSSRAGAFALSADAVKLIITTKDLNGGYVLYVEPEGANTTLPVTPGLAKMIIDGDKISTSAFLSSPTNEFYQSQSDRILVGLAKHYFVAIHLGYKTFSFYTLQEKYPPGPLFFDDLVGKDKEAVTKLNDYGFTFELRQRRRKWMVRVIEYPR